MSGQAGRSSEPICLIVTASELAMADWYAVVNDAHCIHAQSFQLTENMNILVILLIVLLLAGGGYGFHSGNHYLGGGAGLVVLILIILLLTGRL